MYTHYTVETNVTPSATEASVPAAPTISHKSPTLSMKTNQTVEPAQTPRKISFSQADNSSSPYLGPAASNPSPAGVSATANWPIDGMNDLHLSSSEPRYFPGVISRRQMTNSIRQGSSHENDVKRPVVKDEGGEKEESKK